MSFSAPNILYVAGGAILLSAIGFVFVFSNESPAPAVGRDVSSPSARSPRTTKSRPPAPALENGRRSYPEPVDTEWKRLAANLNPEKAREMLDHDRQEEKNLDLRAERAWNIINQLCRNGYALEAWSLIEQSPGLIRERGLGGFFRDAMLPEAELLGMINQLQNYERATSLYNYWSRFTPEQFIQGVDLAAVPMHNPAELGAFTKTIEELLNESHDPAHPEAAKATRRNLLAMALTLVNDGTMNYAEFKSFLGKDPSKDGFTYWEVMRSVNPEIRAAQIGGKNNFDGPDAMVIRAMTMQDPEKTMNMTLVPNAYEENYIQIAMASWLSNDFDNAEQWVKSHETNFTPNQRERTAVAFVRAQVSRGEYESAYQWLQKIETPRWRGAVWSEVATLKKNLPQLPLEYTHPVD